MTNNTLYIASTIILGLGATLIMDLWALFLRRAFNIPSLNYGFVGRWILHMPSGTFKHTSIFASLPKSGERAAGWIAHYLTGVIFAFTLVILAPDTWLNQPTIMPALLLGLATVGFPFFIMQPAFGLGVAGTKTPNPNQTRQRSVMAHCAFGIGLYVCALPISQLLRAYS
ncbi:Uncharacterised protein [BD1-7 clade bacterium]|uniref:DUF2938 domain-containing protein n=1 Tax=BD1-7 clade bacterium TaxID=2029982 RepID=A0A5S9PGP4_9GAMM|nr:Uncharacterised protein [BD1-7 clade bacterium]CAA0103352.1 Uncharacterised protein [BD1-7 clade bacterium]